jgi:hypothetical protein
MCPLLAASTPKEMSDAGHPSVELILGEEDVSELAFSICDKRL